MLWATRQPPTVGGFEVIATDPRPDAESQLRRYIDTAGGFIPTLGN